MSVQVQSIEENKRAYKRRAIDRDVRYIARSTVESTGRLVNVSEGGLFMITDLDADVGEEIIAYPEGLGRLVGRIVRKEPNGVAVEFELSESQRDHLAKRIGSAETGAPYLRLLEERAHDRMELNLEAVARIPADGAEIDCIIVNLSQSGAALRSEARPPIGKRVCIGSMQGTVCRHMSDGFAIEFG